MKCPYCGKENSNDAKFCRDCGMRLVGDTPHQDRTAGHYAQNKGDGEGGNAEEVSAPDSSGSDEESGSGTSDDEEAGKRISESGEAESGAGAREPRSGETGEGDRNEEDFLTARKIAIVAVVLIAVLLFGILFSTRFSSLLGFQSQNTPALSSTSTTTVMTTTLLPRIFNPTNGTFYGDLEYNSSTTLTGDIIAFGSIIVDNGVTLTAGGHSVISERTFNNSGILSAGYPNDNAALGADGRSYISSYGGSGGSGGGGGGTPTNGLAPQWGSATVVLDMYRSGMTNYLTGGGGGGGCLRNGRAGNGGNTLVMGGVYTAGSGPQCNGYGGKGGSGSYGIFIEANAIVAGAINANGQQGFPGQPDGGGGGGGGALLFVYGSGGYRPGTYNLNGGIGTAGGGQQGGGGGNGQVLNYSYGAGRAPVYFQINPQFGNPNKTAGKYGVYYLGLVVSYSNSSANSSIAVPGSNVWTLPKSMEHTVVPVTASTYAANTVVVFNTSSTTGYFVNSGAQAKTTQCIADSARTCLVAYYLPGIATNFTITAKAGNYTYPITVILK